VVNNAFSSVFAPFPEISPKELKRTTRSPISGPYGTTRAHRMLPVTEAPSCWSARAVAAGIRCRPGTALPSTRSTGSTSRFAASCSTSGPGCDHHGAATRGQHPAVRLGRSRLPRRASRSRRSTSPRWPPARSPTPPIIRASRVPDRRLHRAHRHRQQDRSRAARRYLARTGYSAQQTGQPRDRRTGQLYQPLDGATGSDHGAHGRFDRQASATARCNAAPPSRRSSAPPPQPPRRRSGRPGADLAQVTVTVVGA